ncbi:DUF4253 domain-containing protein [Agromyces archimandritae]|uniref:DUF4253 domain-containing protein n=1 Tax=Agromyces archimandritae TaxID=2781962 RepID=A0A975FPF8_9MICO|nr:DUF4253 domain-containing protein [Agromyces archimandritae]QTX05696.1 DUF4253 domain-containing protein [Agromyces archimandritae]
MPHLPRDPLTIPIQIGRPAGPGVMPEPGAPIGIGGVELPAGRLVSRVVDAASSDIAWQTVAALPDAPQLWLRLAAVFGQTGLWPLLEDLVAATAPAAERRRPGGRGAGRSERFARFREGRRAAAERAAPTAAPFRPLATGSAPAGFERFPTVPASPPFEPMTLALVPTADPADVPARIGWALGRPVGIDADAFGAALRSWQRRFGAYIFASRRLVVTRPPLSQADAELLAAEHRWFAPATVERFDAAHGTGSYAVGLVGATRWHFDWEA